MWPTPRELAHHGRPGRHQRGARKCRIATTQETPLLEKSVLASPSKGGGDVQRGDTAKRGWPLEGRGARRVGSVRRVLLPRRVVVGQSRGRSGPESWPDLDRASGVDRRSCLGVEPRSDLDAALAPIAALRLARTPGPRIIDPRRIGVGPRESSGCIATGARGRARPHRLHRRTRRLPGPQGHAPTSLSRPPSTPHTEAAPRLRRPPRPQGVHDVSPARFGVRGVDRSRPCRARSPRREPRWST